MQRRVCVYTYLAWIAEKSFSLIGGLYLFSLDCREEFVSLVGGLYLLSLSGREEFVSLVGGLYLLSLSGREEKSLSLWWEVLYDGIHGLLESQV